MLVQRQFYASEAKRILKSRPILAVLGPRQCGKTTLAKELMQTEMAYLDLERPSDFAKLSADPELYLSQLTHPLVIDEAQRMPEFFPLLRSEVDRRKKKGQFVVLGSSSFQLVKSISESLSGRVGFLDLSPLGLYELDQQKTSLEAHWIKGGFPDALLETKKEELNFAWFEDYTRTLIERDLPSLGIEILPHQFRKLWEMCRHFHGQLLNMNKMASSLDLSPTTVKRYLDILEQTFMIRRLPAFFGNQKKRLVKSPKFYFRDSGMFHYFSRIMTIEDLISHPDRGKSFEAYVLEQILQLVRLKTPEYESFFFRTSDQIEVDLLLKKARSIVPIEIKASLAPTKQSCKSLYRYLELTKIKRAFVISLGDDCWPMDSRIEVIGIHWWRKQGFPSFWL